MNHHDLIKQLKMIHGGHIANIMCFVVGGMFAIDIML